MKLSQTETDRVLIYSVAQMARRRRARGLRLNFPEAVALITDEMMELARDGHSYEEVRSHGARTLTATDVLPGVPILARGMVCEPLFDDGPRVIVLAEPIAVEASGDRPGCVQFGDGTITLNEGRDSISVVVTNQSEHVVTISSHYHFFEINPRMEFERPLTYGYRLDIQAGRSVAWAPGETKDAHLVRFAGDEIVDGFQMIRPPSQVIQ